MRRSNRLALRSVRAQCSPRQTTDRTPKAPAPGARENSPELEIDVADPRYADPAFWLDRTPDISPEIYVRLQELHPGDPGELSGAELRFLDYAHYSVICAYMGTHCVGYLDSADLIQFLRLGLDQLSNAGTGAGGLVVAELSELYPQIEPRRPSGAQILCHGPALGVWFGNHCLGVIGGPAVAEFLRRSWLRATIEPGLSRAERSAKVVNIKDGSKK